MDAHVQATLAAGEQSAGSVGKRPNRRLAFLDVLRGLAALSVVVSHAGASFLTGYSHFDTHIFRFGQFGVVVFFLCSGFIIPASLERHESLRGFWISRFFRLFPLYWIAIGAALILHVAGAYPLAGAYAADPVRNTIVNLSMIAVFLKQPLLIGLSWTLAFELGFYVMTSGLFIAKINRRSIPLAGLWLSVALALGLHSHLERAPVALIGAALASAGVFAFMAVKGVAREKLIVVAVVGVIGVLLIVNPLYAPWYNALLFSAMFVGTVFYRWVHGEVTGRSAGCVGLAAVGVAVVSSALASSNVAFVPTLIAAYGLFGLAVICRNGRFPRFSMRLGVISYSIYLLHPLVLGAIGLAPTGAPIVARVGLLLATILVVILAAEVSFRTIERPMITRGHRIAKKREQSAGPERDADAGSRQLYHGEHGKGLVDASIEQV